MDFNQVLDGWNRLPLSLLAMVWGAAVVVIFLATFFWRMHKSRDVWSALWWALWNALAMLAPYLYSRFADASEDLPFDDAAEDARFNHDANDRRKQRKNRKNRRAGSLSDEF